MYPHERSLVKKMEGKPFVLVGVNSDADRETVKKVVAKEGLTWRSFWDGGSADGPIARRWNVSGWPTLYLIDHRGVIVARVGVRKKDQELIEQKVKEAEAAARKK
jgi:cytochrome oxidase Cu insertion factor (SCO1/SenC/PrrC family)